MTLRHLPLRGALLLAVSSLPLAALAEATSPAPTQQVEGAGESKELCRTGTEKEREGLRKHCLT